MDCQQISQQEWELLFGHRDSDIHKSYRGAEARYALTEVSCESPFTQQKQKPTATKPSLKSQLIEEDPEHCIRTVMLANGVDTFTVFQFLVEFVHASHKNVKVLQDCFSIIGFAFEGTRFAQFRVQLFSHKNEVGVNVKFLGGDAQDTINTFWSELQTALVESDFSVGIKESNPLTQSDEEFFDDWLSEEEDAFQLPIPDFTCQEPDVIQPNYVNDLMEDMQDQSFMLHSLMLLAWNCQLQQNLEVISSAGQAQQLFDLMITCLVTSATDFCLPIARSASLLVNKLVETGAIEISEQQFEVLVKTIVQWTIQTSGDSETVTQSEEIAHLLSSKLPQIAQDVSNSECIQQLHEVYCRVPYQSVRQNIKPLVEAY